MTIRVLIVDDDAVFRRVATALCVARGFTVVGEAVDVASGVLAARRLAPDAVLMDVNLPDGTGLAAARQMTVSAGSPRVLLTSTEMGQWSAEDIAGSGAVGFVGKEYLASADLGAMFGAACSQP